MSKLYFGDNGFVIPHLCEELTKYRRAAKLFDLPQTVCPANLFFLARPHSSNGTDLIISINGHPPIRIPSKNKNTVFAWYKIKVSPGLLIVGTNKVEFWTESESMDSWALALDTQALPNSFSYISYNSGRDWHCYGKGVFSIGNGEYLVRIRLEEGSDVPPPAWKNEDFEHARLEYIRNLIPKEILSLEKPLDKVKQLASWVSQSWNYTSSYDASIYTPWDPATIYSWSRSRKGTNGKPTISFCVHYAVFFVTACQALGLIARCAVFTENINSFNGHFTAEVWLPEFEKWVFVDPNIDAMFYKRGIPLSVTEIRKESRMADLMELGPGYSFQIQGSAIVQLMELYSNGSLFRLRGIWPRNDFLSHPEKTPPGHGSIAYCETDFIWEKDQELLMFPYLVDTDYFDTPPKMRG
ncbi:MAG: transglutaminase-like domain-containing protein [Anaerolineaceae bacterium]